MVPACFQMLGSCLKVIWKRWSPIKGSKIHSTPTQIFLWIKCETIRRHEASGFCPEEATAWRLDTKRNACTPRPHDSVPSAGLLVIVWTRRSGLLPSAVSQMVNKANRHCDVRCPIGWSHTKEESAGLSGAVNKSRPHHSKVTGFQVSVLQQIK